MTIKGKELYLEPKTKKVPVPRYLYKIITNEDGNSEVYVFSNNPFETKQKVETELQEMFGKDIFEASKKLHEESSKFGEVSRGYTIRMSYSDFIGPLNKILPGQEFPENPVLPANSEVPEISDEMV